MKHRFTALSLLLALAAVACATSVAFAQEEDTMPARPMFGHLKPNLTPDNGIRPPATPLTTWNGSFVYLGTTYKYNMVGTSPTTGTSTTIPSFIIPVKLSYKTTKGTTSFTPLTKLSNGQTAIANIEGSPLFQTMDFTSNGVDMGTTQYEDAFQRGNFWGTVSTQTGYHVLLGTPKVLPTLSLTVPSADGKIATEFGVRVGLADINWFDLQLHNYMTKNSATIVPNSIPIFVTYDVYLTSGGCCIGGYHSSFGSSSAPQAYAHFTYINHAGAFSQDVSALSHELGEWMDDPLVVNTGGNPVACGILEVGDPEEGFTNYGAFPYTLNGFTYNLQDLVFLEYFGAPNTTSVGGAETFHGNPFGLGICNNGG